MKCPNCGAEIGNNTRVCEFCGSTLSSEMRKEQEQINKAGCPKCGSSNVTFEREKQGEIKGKKETAIIRDTIGVCHDCGHTWNVQGAISEPKKKRTWLWVLGWIFIFPVPLTILMLRPENKLDKRIRYAIIAIAWIVYLILFINGASKDTEKSETSANVVTESIEKEKQDTSSVDIVLEENSKIEDTGSYTKEDSVSIEDKNPENENTNGVTPELKEFLDKYEEFFDKYIAFMETYDESDAMMLVEYASMMKTCYELTEKAEAYDAEDMSPEDSAYYLEVITRVNKKLADAAITIE